MLPFYVRHEVLETPTTDKLVLIPTFVKFLRVIPLSLPHSITLTYQHLSHTPMIPSEEANAALNDTLKDVQSLIKRCMKLKEGNSATALALSDEIARCLAKDLKLYEGSATLFSPQLLSCATVVRQYTKGGMFTSSPDWTTVGDNDPRIKDHPRFQKTIHYRAPTGSEKTEHELASLAQMDVQQAVLSFPSLDGPEGSPRADIQTPVKLLPSMEKPAAKSQAKHVPSKKAQPTTRFSRAEKKVVHHLLDDTITERPMDLMKTHPDPPAKPNVPQLEPVLTPATANSSTCIRETQVSSSAPGNPPEPEPSARDILHSIHDLGKHFDLLATNERVDTMDERLDLVEERLDIRLTVLEQRLSTSAEQWKATLSTVGNLSMSVWKHINDVAVHRPREHVGGCIASQQDNASHLPWTFRNAGSGNEDIALSQIGRPAHGLTERSNIRRAHYSGRSTSAAQILGVSLSLLSSPLSSRFSSAPPGMSGE
ncbi:hypothetical protein C8R48DRAFT_767020 [Suillus tomentosus]|nr:hypothetical protein C8R48DRAFT_767020 [Suillus tomentosus]